MSKSDYPHEVGTWILVSPSGKEWTAESPIRAVSAEQADRIPANVRLMRIYAAVDEMDELDAREAIQAAKQAEPVATELPVGILFVEEPKGERMQQRRYDPIRMLPPGEYKLYATAQQAEPPQELSDERIDGIALGAKGYLHFARSVIAADRAQAPQAFAVSVEPQAMGAEGQVPEGYRLVSGLAYGQQYHSLICPEGKVILCAYEQGNPTMFVFLNHFAAAPDEAVGVM